jgi:ubiquitin-like protein Pup
MAQEQKQPRKGSEEEAPVAPPSGDAEAQANKEKLDDDIDAILDEIDEVLESNAEDFVKSFIQKGGE